MSHKPGFRQRFLSIYICWPHSFMRLILPADGVVAMTTTFRDKD